jgi:glycosyltransferase involved in cell wall biosynthesis
MKQEGGKKIIGNYDLISIDEKPIVSIITVVYNSKDLIEKTIQNILSQTYKNIEYIIIDGASTDGTLDIVKKYNSAISYWISEKDKGLYDAMNKGLHVATGDYVWFINSGDLVNENETIEKIFSSEVKNADVIFGDVMYVDENFNNIGLRSKITNKSLPQKLTFQSFKYGMVVGHQGFLMKRKLAPDYDLKYRYVADYDWEINCMKRTENCVKVNLTLAKFLVAGVSTQQRKKCLEEKYQIIIKHWGKIIGNINWLINAARAAFSYVKRRKYVEDYGIQ